MRARVYLQDENKEVHRLAPLVDVVVRRPLVVAVDLDLLDDVRVAQHPQQHLVQHLGRAEQAHL